MCNQLELLAINKQQTASNSSTTSLPSLPRQEKTTGPNGTELRQCTSARNDWSTAHSNDRSTRDHSSHLQTIHKYPHKAFNRWV